MKLYKPYVKLLGYNKRKGNFGYRRPPRSGEFFGEFRPCPRDSYIGGPGPRGAILRPCRGSALKNNNAYNTHVRGEDKKTAYLV